jgi:hypothetical protein
MANITMTTIKISLNEVFCSLAIEAAKHEGGGGVLVGKNKKRLFLLDTVFLDTSSSSLPLGKTQNCSFDFLLL